MVAKTPRQIILEHCKKIREGAEPMAGIFYVVPKKGGGNEVLPEYQQEDTDVGHSDFWEEKVAKYLVAEFGVTGPDVEALKLATYGVPRGRIAKPAWHHIQEFKGKWVIHFGGEKEVTTKIKKMVEKDFNLTVLAVNGQIVWTSKHDDHEFMQAYDRAVVKRILGV